MRYALLIYSPPAQVEPTQEMTEAVMVAYNDFTREVVEAGAMRGGEALEDTRSATTVRVREGSTLVTDGPFAETKEEFGGFYLVEAANIDEAIKWAAKIPAAQHGSIEVRPIWELPGGSIEESAGVGAPADSAAG